MQTDHLLLMYLAEYFLCFKSESDGMSQVKPQLLGPSHRRGTNLWPQPHFCHMIPELCTFFTLLSATLYLLESCSFFAPCVLSKLSSQFYVRYTFNVSSVPPSINTLILVLYLKSYFQENYKNNQFVCLNFNTYNTAFRFSLCVSVSPVIFWAFQKLVPGHIYPLLLNPGKESDM